MRRRIVVLIAAIAVIVPIGLFLRWESGTCQPPSVAGASWPPLMADSNIKYISPDGIDFAYVEAGAGPLVLLLLHGYPETPAVWAKAMPALAQAGYYVVAPYMRGYPPSGAPADGDYSIRALGKDALTLIHALGYQHAIIIGHDWGASAGYAAAFRSPAAVEKLVAVSIPHPTALAGDPGVLWRASHFIEYQLPGLEGWLTTKEFCHVDAIYGRWAPGWTPPRAVLDSVKDTFRADSGFHDALGYYRSFFSNGAAEPGDLTADSKISVPVLAIGGGQDGAIEASRYTLARRASPDPMRPRF
jgi:pimeloyl-ACP methyl ester carboxylesterase